MTFPLQGTRERETKRGRKKDVSPCAPFEQASFHSSKEYWVERGEHGNGTSEGSPAGNITYVLTTYNLTNCNVGVKPGIYDASIEQFPLTLKDSNTSFFSLHHAVVIKGRGDGTGWNVTADRTSIFGFTITNFACGISIRDCHLPMGGSHTMEQETRGYNPLLVSNVLKSNKYGLRLENTSENKFGFNNFTHNEWGLWIQNSQENLIAANNFMENAVQAYDTTGENHFNASYEGNYWSDYNGSDLDGDDIGDTPYEIPGEGGSKDYHPSLELFYATEEKGDGDGDGMAWVLVPIAIGGAATLIAVTFYVLKRESNPRG